LHRETFIAPDPKAICVVAVSRSWRYGWLLIGVVGLMVLVNWPEPSRDKKAGPERIPPQTVADQQAQVEAQQKRWLEALWPPAPSAASRNLASGLDPDGVLDELQTRPLHLLFIGDGCRRDQRPTTEATLVVLQLLLAAGADPNAMDSRGNTPLMLAVTHCDARVILQLIAAGADPERINSRGLTAFEMTLSSPGDAAYALLETGFRLKPEQLRSYREIYADESPVMALLEVAGSDPAKP
jgi:hypothetical protein